MSKTKFNDQKFLKFKITDHIYTRSLESGLGDRLIVLLGTTAVSKLFDKNLYYYWSNSRKIDAAKKIGRYYRFDIIDKVIKWPTNFIINKSKIMNSKLIELKHRNGGLIPCNEAFDCVPDLIPFTYDEFCPDPSILKDYIVSLTEVCNEFDILIGNIPTEKYICLHIRGGDKRNLHDVNDTNNILKVIEDKLQLPVLIVTDDDIFRQQFKISHNLTFEYSKYDTQEERDLYDLKLLMNSRYIIQYSPNGWSAYSNLASMLRKIPLLNCSSQSFNRLDEFRKKGSNLNYWFKKDELNLFLNFYNI
jgi:hypothetical protein